MRRAAERHSLERGVPRAAAFEIAAKQNRLPHPESFTRRRDRCGHRGEPPAAHRAPQGQVRAEVALLRLEARRHDAALDGRGQRRERRFGLEREDDDTGSTVDLANLVPEDELSEVSPLCKDR